MSSVGTASYLSLVKQAVEGKLKLPAFQRDWKWKRRQVVELFDSLRNQYPIGSFLLANESDELDLSPRSFKFSSPEAHKETTASVVLDGQQRITAGIQLFHVSSSEQSSHYFLDIEKLEKLFQDFAKNRDVTVSALLDDEDGIVQFVKDLDTDSGYLKATNKVADPYSRLNAQHLLFSPLLLSDRDKNLETYLDSYFEKYPSKKPFLRNVIKQHFQIKSSPLIPYIVIEGTDVSGLSRIFTTLNTSGKLLTPFELVVAILFPQDVHLQEEIEDAKRLYPTYYRNMDATGEIVLQSCVLMDGGDPKKSLLPKTLTKKIWLEHKEEAFRHLEQVGQFLRNHLGIPLHSSAAYTPYDSVFAPLAYTWSKINLDSLNQVAKGKAISKISKFVVAAAIDQRYQEGVHNKQRSDAKALVEWITSADDSQEPAWMKEVAIPSLKRVAPSGAIGRMILCLLNRNQLRDPITNELVPLGSNDGENHHIFPTKFVSVLPDWQEKNLNSNVVLNIMRTTKETNGEYLHANPRDQMLKASECNSLALLEAGLKDQGIPPECLTILMKPEKSAADFADFIHMREAAIQKMLGDEFKLPITAAEPEDMES